VQRRFRRVLPQDDVQLLGVGAVGVPEVHLHAVFGAGGGLLLPASLGALLACALVLLVGAFVHRPLSRVPENTLKFGVGVMLSAFGVFWIGEGFGLDWPGQDLALLVFAAIFLGAVLAGTAIARNPEIARDPGMEVAR
jgi:uncharacterized membrane protein